MSKEKGDHSYCRSAPTVGKKTPYPVPAVGEKKNISNQKVIRVFHNAFSHLNPRDAATHLAKELKRSKVDLSSIQYLMTGAGFGYVFYECGLDQDSFFNDGDRYLSGISNIEDALVAWGTAFRRHFHKTPISITNKDLTCIVGVDGGVMYRGRDWVGLDAQVALWIPGNGAIKVIWKCYPTGDEQENMLFPIREEKSSDGWSLPDRDAIAGHYIGDNLILVCNDFASLVEIRGKKSDGRFRGEVSKEMKAAGPKKLENVFCLVHKDPRSFNSLKHQESLKNAVRATNFYMTTGVTITNNKNAYMREQAGSISIFCEIW